MGRDKLLLLCFVVLCFGTTFVFADIPAHCVYDQVVGDWVFMMGPDGNDNSISCENEKWQISKWQQITLSEPDVAHDAYGNKGFWTLIYDQGFEVVINDIKYFAFFDYSINGTNVTSYCSRTSPGWYHNIPSAPGAIPKNWGCYSAARTDFMQGKEITHTLPLGSPTLGATRFVEDHEFVTKLNEAQSSWTAGINPSWVGEELATLQRKAGKVMPEYRRIQTTKSKRLLAKSSQDERVMSTLPLNFDWRNVSGINYDSPVRDQLDCGSCYAHATVEMLEARTRILTNNTNQVLLSPQVVVSCSQYSQGCNGGFTYLVSKYGEDFGLVTEGCFPYQSGLNPNVSCSAGCNEVSQKRFVTNYTYVGGYYGGCSEAAMMLELYNNGPIAIAFEVYPDFMHYTSGIYHHVDNLVGVNGWEITNHEVVIVGWGVDAATGEKYWIVKNSWGFHFGEGGYFKIRRGTDECSIESSAYSSFPVL